VRVEFMDDTTRVSTLPPSDSKARPNGHGRLTTIP
jgi:hypothetical protein